MVPKRDKELLSCCGYIYFFFRSVLHAWDGVDYDPQKHMPYVRVYNLPTVTELQVLASPNDTNGEKSSYFMPTPSGIPKITLNLPWVIRKWFGVSLHYTRICCYLSVKNFQFYSIFLFLLSDRGWKKRTGMEASEEKASCSFMMPCPTMNLAHWVLAIRLDLKF